MLETLQLSKLLLLYRNTRCHYCVQKTLKQLFKKWKYEQ